LPRKDLGFPGDKKLVELSMTYHQFFASDNGGKFSGAFYRTTSFMESIFIA
jgi:hypothetical protein